MAKNAVASADLALGLEAGLRLLLLAKGRQFQSGVGRFKKFQTWCSLLKLNLVQIGPRDVQDLCVLKCQDM